MIDSLVICYDDDDDNNNDNNNNNNNNTKSKYSNDPHSPYLQDFFSHLQDIINQYGHSSCFMQLYNRMTKQVLPFS